jgi:tetratricopeptide (TPR) repeat protein
MKFLSDVEAWVTTAFQGLIATPWLGVGCGGLVLVMLLAAVLARKRRRRARQARDTALTRKVDQEAQSLLSDLRERLWEPPKLFDDHLNGAPTMGARDAFEGDIRRAAGSILREAGGERRKAREILRQRLLQGHDATGATLSSASEETAGIWRQLGALSLVDGSRDAVVAYARAVDLAPQCAESHMMLGVLQLRGGRLDAAEQSFQRHIALLDAPESSPMRYRGRTMLGDVYAARHETAAALAAYRQAQAEIETLRAIRPKEEQLELSRDLSVMLDRIGDTLHEQGEHADALASYTQGLAIAEQLARAEGQHSLGLYHDLSVSHERIGDVLDKRGDLAGAALHFRKSLAISRALVKREPGNRMWAWDLSTSYERLADVLHAQGKRTEALRLYRQGLEIAERLVTGSGLSEATFQRDLAVSYHKIGSLEAVRGNASEARELLEKGRAIIAQLDRIAAHQAQWRSDLSKFDAALKTVH